MTNKYIEMLSKAKTAFVNERFDEAIKICKEILSEKPHDVESTKIYARSLFYKEDYENSEIYFKSVCEMAPEDAEANFDLGTLYLTQENYSDTMAQYALAIQKGCSEEVANKIYYVMGTINMEINGDNKNALANFEKVGFEELPDVLLDKIQIYVEENNYTAAENCALQLKLLLPSEYTVYDLLFNIYMDSKDFDKARNTLREAGEILKNADKTVTDANEREELDKSRIDLLKKKITYACVCADNETEHAQKVNIFSSAITSIENALTGDKYNFNKTDVCDLHLYKTEVYLRLDDIESVKSELEVIENLLEDDNEEMNEYLERILFLKITVADSEKDYETALETAKKLINSENIFLRHHAYYTIAHALQKLAESDKSREEEKQKAYDYAIAYFKNENVKNPGDFIASLYRAMCYADNGNIQEAKEISRRLPEENEKELLDYLQKLENGEE